MELFQQGLLEATVFPESGSRGLLSASQKAPLSPSPFPATGYFSRKSSLTPWLWISSPPITTPDTALKTCLSPPPCIDFAASAHLH